MSKARFPFVSVIEKGKRNLPPGSPRYLLFQLSDIQDRPIEFLGHHWRKYGDLVRLPVMPGLTLFLAAHPDYVEHILSTHAERYRKPDFFLKPMGLLEGQGLFTSEGELWRKQRRLMQPAFHQKQLVKLHEIMLSCVNELVCEWENKLNGAEIDIAAEMTRLTLKIVSLTLFSIDISDESDRLAQAFRTALEYVYYRLNTPLALPLWMPTQRNLKFRQAKQTIDRIVLEIIRSRRQNLTKSDDLLSMLLATRDEDTGEEMSDRQLRDEVITLIGAGHETTATALAWTWYILGTNPHVMTRMHDEIQTGLDGSHPTFEKLPNLQYTRRIFEESLRLFPPGLGLAPRVALEDDEIHGYFIPKGSILNIVSYFTSRHPDFWENPELFDPDRFLPENTQQRHKFAYIPFGAGSHTCIGKSFALMESTTILAGIVQRFHIELVPEQPIEIDPRFTLRPKYGIKVILRKKD